MMITNTTLTCVLLVSFALSASQINGTMGSDVLDGTDGNDVINGLGGYDDIDAGAGDDILNGGPGPDFLFGGDGDDIHNGGLGDDTLRGVGGDDIFHGGAGNDTIDFFEDVSFGLAGGPCPAGTDNDHASGGAGDDDFYWASSNAVFPPLPFVVACISTGDSTADGGAGMDSIVAAVGSFRALSSDYVLEEAVVPGYEYRLRSLVNGVSLDFRGIERIEFLDATWDL